MQTRSCYTPFSMGLPWRTSGVELWERLRWWPWDNCEVYQGERSWENDGDYLDGLEMNMKKVTSYGHQQREQLEVEKPYARMGWQTSQNASVMHACNIQRSFFKHQYVSAQPQTDAYFIKISVSNMLRWCLKVRPTRDLSYNFVPG